MQAEAAELIDELVTPITLRSIAPELHHGMKKGRQPGDLP
jgi:hypothetical protein